MFKQLDPDYTWHSETSKVVLDNLKHAAEDVSKRC